MAQVSCRVPSEVEEALQAAANEHGVFKADIVRRAIVHYIQENPQEFAVLSNGLESSNDSNRRIYDPLEDVDY